MHEECRGKERLLYCSWRGTLLWLSRLHKCAARGRSCLCIQHGWGKRALWKDALSAEGKAGPCISHGGGCRCQFPGCNKGAPCTVRHMVEKGGACLKAALKGLKGAHHCARVMVEGSAASMKGVVFAQRVSMAPLTTVLHVGGKQCVVPGCTKSARGQTNCCVRHGGGRWCKSSQCGKSAQGSTDFCKAHGGGKRCSWGCATHGSMVVSQQEQESVESGSTVGPTWLPGALSASETTIGSGMDYEYSSSTMSALSDGIESTESMGRTQVCILPQVLVPSSMKSTSTSPGLVGAHRNGGNKDSPGFVTEGRVHGGGLLALFWGQPQECT